MGRRYEDAFPFERADTQEEFDEHALVEGYFEGDDDSEFDHEEDE